MQVQAIIIDAAGLQMKKWKSHRAPPSETPFLLQAIFNVDGKLRTETETAELNYCRAFASALFLQFWQLALQHSHYFLGRTWLSNSRKTWDRREIGYYPAWVPSVGVPVQFCLAWTTWPTRGMTRGGSADNASGCLNDAMQLLSTIILKRMLQQDLGVNVEDYV